MKPIIVLRTIKAPLDLVFQTVSDVRDFSKAVPKIIRIQFLSEQQQGVGTRFRETRLMNGREQSVDLEVVEFEPNERVRMTSDAGGTIWDTVFLVSQEGSNVNLRMQMDVRPYRFLARIMNFLIRGMVVKAVESDMDAVKLYCESSRSQADVK